MVSKAVLVYVCLAFRSLVFSGPINTVLDFNKFIDDQDKQNACPFPPVILLDKANMKPCLETKKTESSAQICDGIVQMSTDVCSLPQDMLIPVLTSLEHSTIGQVCEEIEKRNVLANNDSCTDVCSEEKALYPCTLFVTMIRVLFNKFSETESFKDIHDYIHNLRNYFPFPRHGSMDKGEFLYACSNETQPNSTKNLCMTIKELALKHGKRNTSPNTFSNMLANVSTNWDPCPKMKETSYMNGSNCDSICKDDPNIKLCRSIVLGKMALQPLGNDSGSNTSVTGSPDIVKGTKTAKFDTKPGNDSGSNKSVTGSPDEVKGNDSGSNKSVTGSPDEVKGTETKPGNDSGSDESVTVRPDEVKDNDSGSNKSVTGSPDEVKGTTTKPGNDSGSNKSVTVRPDEVKDFGRIAQGRTSSVVYALVSLVFILGAVIVYIKQETILAMLNPFGCREQQTNKGYKRLKTDDTFLSLDKTK